MTKLLVQVVALLFSSTGTPDPAFTVGEYKQLIIDQRAQIHSMGGAYVFETVPDALAQAAGAMRGQVAMRKNTFAWSGEKRMKTEDSIYVGENHKPFSGESVNVYDGKEFRSRKRSRRFHIQKPKSAYSELNNYLSGLKWPFTEAELTNCKTNPPESDFLPYFLEAKNWRVRPQREVVNEVMCVVLEQAGNGRRLWLDPQRGYCLVRLVHDRPASGHKQWINEYFNFRQIIPGIYLPMKIVGKNILEDVNGKNIGSLTTTLTVTDLHVNDVLDGVFVLEPKAGDTVRDSIRGKTYV